MGCLCPRKKDSEKKNRLLSQENENNLHYEYVDKNKNKTEDLDLSKYGNIEYDEDFAKKALNKNNYYRELHGAKPLVLDENLGKRACIIAKPVLLNQSYENEELLTYGKNEELGMIDLRSEEELSPEQLMEKWYSEIEQYDFKEPKDFECMEFAQMIWKDSKKFGIGYYHLENDMPLNISEDKESDMSNIKYVYVALYYPGGNKPGKYKDNIREPKTKKKEEEK